MASPALWDFACLLYSRDGVKSALLAMQDEHRLDIPFTLFALWAGLFHRAMTAGEIQSLAAVSTSLSANLVEPVRSARRRLKQQLPDAASPYQDLLNAELAAEKRVLDTLAADFLPGRPGTVRGAAQAVANLELYLELMNIPRQGDNAARLAAVFRHLPPPAVS